MTPAAVPELHAVYDDGPAVERDLAFDMVKRGLPFVPVMIGFWWLVSGREGALSSAFALVLVFANLVLAAVSLAWAAKVNLGVLMGTAMFGFLVRFGLVCAAVLAIRQQSWVELVPLGITLIVAHLGLLLWELRFVSATLAFPGLRPKPTPLSAFSSLGSAGAKE